MHSCNQILSSLCNRYSCLTREGGLSVYMHRRNHYSGFFSRFQVEMFVIKGKIKKFTNIRKNKMHGKANPRAFWLNKWIRGIDRKVSPLIQTRFGRNRTDYDLHEMAGGLPLSALSAPNVHPSSKRGREVCNRAEKSNIPIIKCGSKR